MKNALPIQARFINAGWKWNAANVALGLVFVLLVTFLWLSHRWQVEDQRRDLVADILWASQNFNFHLRNDEVSLVALGQEAVERRLPATDFEHRVQHLLSNNPELVQVTLLDGHGDVLEMFPVSVDKDGARRSSSLADSNEAQRLSLRLGKPVYSGVYRTAGGEMRFALFAPLFLNGVLAGRIIGEYSLSQMMQYLVPWWYAEKYQLAVLSSTGAVLATKSNVSVDDPDLTYDVPLDPPGGGMILRATTYPLAGASSRNFFLSGIIVLSVVTLWSVLALRRDMHQRIEAEQELRAEHAFRQAMEDSMLTGIMVKGLDGSVTYVNPAFCRMTGYSRQELLGQSPPFHSPVSRESSATAVREHRRDDIPAEGFELRFQCKNGAPLDVLVHEAPLIDSEGKRSGWMSSVLDITERKRAQELARQQSEQLQFTSRLVTMGEMASTLAHELNQPLSAITSYITGARNRLERGDLQNAELQQVLTTTATQVQRAGRIVHRIHEFVRRRAPNRGNCDINQVAEEAAGFLEAEARRNGTRIRLDLAHDVPNLHADSVLLEQVVLNLAKNGIEAMAEIPAAGRELQVCTENNGGTVTVSISDHGCGIAPDIVQKLFSPFFTTKEAGMGMGLNICRSIIEFHSGTLWFEPNADGGSVFRFSLPVARS